jgi:ubiquitin-like-conjugating enzyme ATG10
MLPNFPHLTPPEFDAACTSLITRFDGHGHRQNKWQSVELISQNSTTFLRITRLLSNTPSPQEDDLTANPEQGDSKDEEVEDDDDQVLTTEKCSVVVNHDIHLSPTYSLPILYTHIADPQHRFPPTMDTLYTHLIPPHFKAQTKITGVMGGVTVAERKGVKVEDYILLWIGALGGCVGLSVPLGLMMKSDEEPPPK